METVIAAVLLSQQYSIRTTAWVLDSLASLALVRVLVFLLMAALLVRRQFELKAAREGISSENQSLLESGDEPANGHVSYGGTPVSAAKSGKKSRDAQSSGWFDYFAGFKILFPYLW